MPRSMLRRPNAGLAFHFVLPLALLVACSSDAPGPGGGGGDADAGLGVDAGASEAGSVGEGGGADSGRDGARPEGGVDGGTEPDPDASVPGLDCTGAAGDPAGAATVEGYMDTLPSPPAAGATRTRAIDAILRTCEAFGPPPGTNPGFQKEHCWAFLTASISKESGYNPTVAVRDGYATRNVGGKQANDPVVGLLQIRFSSTVHEVSVLGSKTRLTCAGCTLPASFAAHASESGNSDFWAVTGPSQNLSVMQDVACNVAMGAWYYFINATGNGKASAVTYPDQYCGGGGTGGNLVTGLLSHLKGSEGGRGYLANQGALNALQASDPGGYGYVTEIKRWWDGMVGPVAGTHPFFLRLAPDPAQYCE